MAWSAISMGPVPDGVPGPGRHVDDVAGPLQADLALAVLHVVRDRPERRLIKSNASQLIEATELLIQSYQSQKITGQPINFLL